MAQAGYTPIQLYYSTTPTNTPSAGNLVDGELAINTADGKLFYKDSGGAVQIIASTAGTAGTVQSVSVVSANGFAGTVGNPSTTPAITLTTTVTGILQGNGTAISAITVGTGLSFSSGILSATGTSSQWVTTGSDIYYNTGTVGIGTTTPSSVAKLTLSANTVLPSAGAQSNTVLWQVGADTIANTILLDSFANATALNGRRASGTAASPTALGANGTIVALSGFGYGATGYSSTARVGINLMSNEAWSDTAQGTRITFSTTANTTTTTSEKMRIDDAGNVGIGTTSPNVKLDVIGSIEASVAATQDGVILAGRAGGTSSFAVTLTPTTLTASRTITLPDSTTTMVGTDTTQTLTNKRVTPRVVSITGAAGGTITPTGDTADQYNITALGAAATFAIPSGTPTDGQKLSIRIEDNGTGRALTWTTSAGGYRVIGTTLPTTTTASKTIYVGCVYNSADLFWDVVAVATQA